MVSESEDGDIELDGDVVTSDDDGIPVRRDFRQEARSIQHLLRHKPGMGCPCDACMRGETNNKPRRQRHNKKDPRPTPEKFSECLTCDHTLMADWWGAPGCGGMPDSFVQFDLGSECKYAEPTTSKDALETYKAIQFMRGKDHTDRLYSDNFGSINKAAKNLGIMWESSQPGTHHNNALIERCNQDVLYNSRVSLVEASLPGCFWVYAMPCL